MDSPQTRQAATRAQEAAQAWRGHWRHCPPCDMPAINRGPCLRGLMLRDRAAAAAHTLREERQADAAPAPGQMTLI